MQKKTYIDAKIYSYDNYMLYDWKNMNVLIKSQLLIKTYFDYGCYSQTSMPWALRTPLDFK